VTTVVAGQKETSWFNRYRTDHQTDPKLLEWHPLPAEAEDQLPQKLPLKMLRGMKDPPASGVRLQNMGSADEATGPPATAPGPWNRRRGSGPQW
jgi:hypothetical protein